MELKQRLKKQKGLIKIQAENSSQHLMFINPESERYKSLLKSINIDISLINHLDNFMIFKIYLESFEKLIQFLEKKIIYLLNDNDFVHKDSGQMIISKDNVYFLNTKKYKIDKKIRTLNSLLVIINYCKKNRLKLVVTNIGNDTD